MSVLRIAMQHDTFQEPQVPLRPSELYTFAPYRWNPTHLIHFARLGDLPILRRYHPRSFASSIPGWPWRKRNRPSFSLSPDEPASPGGSLPGGAPQVPPGPNPPVPDPCATETVVKALRALRPNRKRPTEEEGGRYSPVQEKKPRPQDSLQSGQPAVQPEAANRDPLAPPVPPRPGSEESATTKASSSSSSTSTPAKRVARNNNILSSYSSSGGIERLWIEAGLDLSQIKRFMPPTEELMGWSWKTLTEERKARANQTRTSTLAAHKVDKQVQASLPPQPVELPLPRWIIPPSPPILVDGRPWRGSRLREVRLFHQAKEPLVMPPAPDPGYKITRADYNADREERWRQFKRGLDSSKDSPPPVDEAPTPASDPSAAAKGGPQGQSNEQLRQNFSGQTGVPGPTLGVPPGPPPPPPTLPAGATGGLASPSAEAPPQSPCPPPHPTAVAVPPPPSNPAQPAGAQSSLATALPSTPKPTILFGMLTSGPPEGQPTVGPRAAVPSPAASATGGSTLFPPVFGSPAQSHHPWGGSGGASTPLTTRATATASSGGEPSYTFQPIFGASQPTSTPTAAASSASTAQPSLALPAGAFLGFSGPLQSPGSGAPTMTTLSTPTPMFSLGGPNGMTSGGAPGGGAFGPLLFGVSPGSSPPTSFSQAPTNGTAPPLATGVTAPLAVTTPSPFGPIRPHAFRAKRGASDEETPPAKVAGLGLERRAAALGTPGLGANQAPLGGGGGGDSSGGSPPGQNPFGGGAAFGSHSNPQPSSGGGASGRPPSQTPFSGAAFGAKIAPQPVAFGGGGNGGDGSSRPSDQNPFGGGAAFGARIAPHAISGAGVSRSAPAQNPFGAKRDPQPVALRGGVSSSPPAQNPFGGGAAFGGQSTPQPVAFGGLSPGLSFGAAPPGAHPTSSTSAFVVGAQPPSLTSNGGSGNFVFGGPAAPSAAVFPFGASTTQASPGGPPSAFGGRRGSNGGGGSSRGQAGNGGSSPSSDATTAGANHTGRPPYGPSGGGAAGPSSIEDKLLYAFRNGPPLPKAWGGSAILSPHETEKSLRAVTPPSFSIGSGTRMGPRQRLQARRQHLKKKN